MSELFSLYTAQSNCQRKISEIISKYDSPVNTFCRYCNALWTECTQCVFSVLFILLVSLFVFCFYTILVSKDVHSRYNGHVPVYQKKLLRL